jgi:4-amino-4-deoxy-L-arabinose transferase-like glycosyltransferase
VVALDWLALLPLFVVWLRIDQLFAPWDHAAHASMVMRLHDGIVAGNPWRFYELSKFYPPLFHLLAVPASFFSTHPDAFCFGNWLALLALLWSTFLLGRSLVGPSAGLAAALLVPAYPYVTIMGRMPMTDLSVAAAVAWTLALLCDDDPLATPRGARRLGLAIAIGMLAKWSYVFFAAAPLLALVIRHARASWQRGATTLYTPLAWLALWPIVLAGPWYVRSIPNLVAQSSWQFGTGVQIAEGDPDPISMASLLYYWPVLQTYYVGRLIGLALLSGLVAIAIVWTGRARAPIAPPSRWTPLLLSVLVGAVCLVVVANKDARYPLPLVPSLAVVSAASLAFFRARFRKPALAGCALLGWLLAWHTLFRLEPPDPTDWKVPATAGSIAAAVRSSASTAPLRVLVVPNDPQMNFISLRYALELALRDGPGTPRKVEVDRIEEELDAARLATYERVVVVWPPPGETIVSRGSVAGAHFVLEQSGWVVESRMLRGDGREIRVLAPRRDPVAPLSASSAGTSRRLS